MSAPNKSYDPVEVEALKPEEIERLRDEAFAAFAAAGDLDALAQAKTAHTGGTSPLSLANREIGALPPQAKAEAGKRVGQARGAVSKALAARQAELEAERDARVLVEEAVDVTLPYDRVPAGARHPLTTIMERVADVFVAMGYEIAEGPEVEAEWFNFDALNFVPDHPARQMQDTFFVQGTTPDGKATEGDESGVVLRTHTSPVQARSLLERKPPSTWSAPAGCTAPTSWTPRTPRSSTRSSCSPSTRASPWPTSRAPSTTWSRRSSGRT